MGFPRADYVLVEKGSENIPLIEMAVLTLVGPDGILPKWVLEKILYEKENGGNALHAFLDIINRRFWELFYQIDAALHLKREGGFAQESLNLVKSLVDCHHEVRAEWCMDLAGFLSFWQSCMVSHNSYCDMRYAVDTISRLLDFKNVYSEPAHSSMRLEISSRAALVIGKSPLACLRTDGGVLGKKLWMNYGSRLRFCLQDRWAFFFRLCTEESARLIQGVVGFFGHHDVSRVLVNLELMPQLRFSILGGQGCRLGMGSCLHTDAPVSLMMYLRLNKESMNDAKQ